MKRVSNPTPAAADVTDDTATGGQAGTGANGNAVVGRRLCRRFGTGTAAVDALREVSLCVDDGELLAIMGPSGSGKSTLLHLLAGLDRPDTGTVTIAGTVLADLNDDDLTRLRRAKMGFVFQFFNLLPMLTAEANIVLPLKLAGRKPDPDWVEEVIERVGLADRRHHLPSQLSGGQQQRVAIGRALVTRPTVIFADEPTGNLDSRSGTDILTLLRESCRTYRQTMVIVTHEPRVCTITDRILVLADGQVVDELDHPDAAGVRAAIDRASVR